MFTQWDGATVPDSTLQQAEALQQRSRNFSIRIVNLFRAMHRQSEEARVLGRQLLRCGTSVAANYRAVCRARSRADFVAKLAIVIEECDETLFWLEFFAAAGMVKAGQVSELAQECKELLAIFAASHRTARAGRDSAND